MLLVSFISSSSGAVRREHHEMDEGQRNTMWPEQMEVSRKSVCRQWDVFSFSLSSAVLCVSCAPFIHQDWGRKMDAISFLLYFSTLLSINFTDLTEHSSHIYRNQEKNKNKQTVIHRRLADLNVPVTLSDILHMLCCTKTLSNKYSVTFMKDKTQYIILYYT